MKTEAWCNMTEVTNSSSKHYFQHGMYRIHCFVAFAALAIIHAGTQYTKYSTLTYLINGNIYLLTTRNPPDILN